MNHNRSREGWIHCLDLFEELEHADGREGNSEIRPTSEVKLGHQPGSLAGITGLLCAVTK